MTATDGRALSALEWQLVRGYARGANISAIAYATRRTQEYVGDVLLRLCHLNRQQAQEIMRRGRTFPEAAPPPPPRAATVPKPAADWSNGGSLLTPVEQQTLESLAAGADCGAIARQFDVPRGTVRKRIYQLRLRLGVDVDGDVVAAAAALGLIPEPASTPEPEPIAVVEPVELPAAAVVVQKVEEPEQVAPERATPKVRRPRMSDAEWWASLPRDERNRVLQAAS